MSQAIDDARQNSNDAVAALSASAAAYSAVSRTCLVAEVAAKNAQAMADAAAKIGRLAREAANLARVDLKRKERSEATASEYLAATIGRVGSLSPMATLDAGRFCNEFCAMAGKHVANTQHAQVSLKPHKMRTSQAVKYGSCSEMSKEARKQRRKGAITRPLPDPEDSGDTE